MQTIYKILALTVITFIMAACKKEQKITVTADFSYHVVEENITIPVRLTLTNTSSGAENYLWTFEGGEPATSTKKDPGTVLFNNAGAHVITLEAWNEDERKTKQIVLQLDSAVSIAFDAVTIVDSISPVQVQLTNRTTGAKTYNWTFDGGMPATSTLQQPGMVTFTTPGEHTITLTANNGSKNFTTTKKITVAPPLQAGFEIIPSFEDEDYQTPLTAQLKNNSISALNYKWTTTGGTIDNDTATSPSIHFTNTGTYTVTLKATNNKEIKTITNTITVLPNTNLYTFTNIKLGINTAHGTIGSFFSTSLRRTFKAGDDLSITGNAIDIVYFGLNQNFTYNKFVSPAEAGSYTFNDIPNAAATRIINSQESCACGTALSVATFDAMTTDAPLQSLNIQNTSGGILQFDNTVTPRIILYQTNDGRKGAIKIKSFVSDGQNSYIIVDIKTQKKQL